MTLTSASLGNKQSLEFFAKKKQNKKQFVLQRIWHSLMLYKNRSLNTYDEWWFTLLWLSLAGVREDQWLGSSYSENAA